MDILVSDTKQELGRAAADAGSKALRQALQAKGEVAIIVATGVSQFEMLSELVVEDGIDWSRVTVFHLDEYVGLPESHPASFRRYLRERFIDKLPIPPAAFHAINGEGDCAAECARLGSLVSAQEIEVAFIGIGENGHLAFNDPPADFDTDEPFIVVNLDDACRNQQFGEGWFPSLDEVPTRAISMSVKQIMKSKAIVCSVADERKSWAVQGAVEGPVTPDLPASILQQHPDATLFLDPASSWRLKSLPKDAPA